MCHIYDHSTQNIISFQLSLEVTTTCSTMSAMLWCSSKDKGKWAPLLCDAPISQFFSHDWNRSCAQKHESSYRLAHSKSLAVKWVAACSLAVVEEIQVSQVNISINMLAIQVTKPKIVLKHKVFIWQRKQYWACIYFLSKGIMFTYNDVILVFSNQMHDQFVVMLLVQFSWSNLACLCWLR